ncbi:hypothetical protein HH310_40050 [Actinoplanes sp. TBRC 11911]|uniref:hypothetical protein n=1 Tax=Actinoplanes sp. TBRC 11911 TaxID=2729386 RepID=UPI00145DB585|nr:hypothetical protein [Actinoplanes sp. TBRC 11911]NMO57353.1 hypothetical protein [Actinoplanes sp. TBRC 11911]
MQIPAQLESGKWVYWRVGRQRLVWLPGGMIGSGFNLFDSVDGTLGMVILVLALGPLLVWLVSSLMLTAVVWPWRMVAGKWPVYAYLKDGNEIPGMFRMVKGKKAADSLVRQWAADIERTGRPQPPEAPR